MWVQDQAAVIKKISRIRLHILCSLLYTVSKNILCPNNKLVYLSRMEVFAGNKIDVIQNQKFVLGRVENIVGKGKNSGY